MRWVKITKIAGRFVLIFLVCTAAIYFFDYFYRTSKIDLIKTFTILYINSNIELKMLN